MKLSIRKQPALLTASFLGLALAATGCASANSQTPEPVKPMMLQHGSDTGMGMHQRGEHKMGKMGKDGMARQMAALNLTDAQKSQIQQLRTQFQAQMQQQRTKMQQFDANIAAQKKAGASTTTLLNLYKQKQASMQQFMTMHQQHQQQFMNILTPEQQLKLYESRDMMQDAHGHEGMKSGKGQR